MVTRSVSAGSAIGPATTLCTSAIWNQMIPVSSSAELPTGSAASTSNILSSSLQVSYIFANMHCLWQHGLYAPLLLGMPSCLSSLCIRSQETRWIISDWDSEKDDEGWQWHKDDKVDLNPFLSCVSLSLSILFCFCLPSILSYLLFYVSYLLLINCVWENVDCIVNKLFQKGLGQRPAIEFDVYNCHEISHLVTSWHGLCSFNMLLCWDSASHSAIFHCEVAQLQVNLAFSVYTV